MSRIDKYRRLPVFQKALELYELADVIAEALKDDDKKEHLVGQIISNAMLIQVKIAGAEGGNLFSIRMQNAVQIKLAVHDMFNAISFASMVEINEEDYVDLMREKVEEFRLAFVDWIRGFDKSYDIPDNWGVRFDVSTPESEKLEELMFNQDERFDEMPDSFDDIDFDSLDFDDEEDDEDDEFPYDEESD